MIPDEKIKQQMQFVLDETDLPLGKKYAGKVRDNYTKDDKRYLVASDRISAFDRILGTIPFKGQVLTQMAEFWLKETKDIVKNHLISTPDPNVMECIECEALPVEAVVRAYNTGSTTTSVWHSYKNGIREFCGNTLPEGMKKDQKFDKPIFTPSTKAEVGDHDMSVSKDYIVEHKLLSQEDIDKIEEISFALFKRGTELVAKQGLILVDTKYEFGKLNGEIVLIDEIHTPDSSRFWYIDTYKELFAKGEEQKKLDKEYVRIWLADRGFTGDGPIPDIPDEIKIEAAKRYITAYELVTGETFKAEVGDQLERIKRNLNV